MDLESEHVVPLSGSDLSTLCVGLSAYLREFEAHRALDDGETHPEAEWKALKRDVGQLIWRLEVAGVPAGTSIEHSEAAVPPDGV